MKSATSTTRLLLLLAIAAIPPLAGCATPPSPAASGPSGPATGLWPGRPDPEGGFGAMTPGGATTIERLDGQSPAAETVPVAYTVAVQDEGTGAPPITPIAQFNQQGAAATPLGGLPPPPPSTDDLRQAPQAQPPAPGHIVQQPPTSPPIGESFPPVGVYPDPMATYPADVVVSLMEGRTGRFNIGVAVNSDAGVTGQISFEERNFDITRLPRSMNDFWEGYAFRGAGQVFRAEAMPGDLVSRYAVSLTEPFLFNTAVSGTVAGSYFNRNYYDWFETRGGGRLGLGYRLADDLSVGFMTRVENVEIEDIRVPGIPDLDNVLGNNLIIGLQPSLTHDTRDFPFMPSEGHYFQASFEQVLGDFQYPRIELDFRKYFLIMQRPDGSGRHTLGLSIAAGWSGEDTPIFEHFFLGGATTLRGFTFRGASPMDNSVTVGGEFQIYGSAEYYFPLTADDMVKGVVFCDYGTVEEEVRIDWDEFRVAPGFGLRLNIPAMGQAPLALDFAFPVNYADTDRKRMFTFNVGIAR